MPIPETIHFTWKNQEELFSVAIPNENGEKITALDCIKSFSNLNPKWKIRFWSDSEVKRFLQDYYPKFYPVWETLTAIEKVDFFRYACLYEFGGLFSDIDCFCARPLGRLVRGASFIAGQEFRRPSFWLNYPPHIQLTLFAVFSEPGHVILKEVIEKVIDNCVRHPDWFIIEKTSMAPFGDIVYRHRGEPGVVILPIDYLCCSGQFKHLRKNVVGPNKKPCYILHCGVGSWKSQEFYDYVKQIEQILKYENFFL